jgi:hypothetical protein
MHLDPQNKTEKVPDVDQAARLRLAKSHAYTASIFSTGHVQRVYKTRLQRGNFAKKPLRVPTDGPCVAR